MDLLPQGYGRKELLNQLDFSENMQEQADWFLLKAGAGNPIGNLRVKEAFEWLQVHFPVQENVGFSLSEIIERKEKFIELESNVFLNQDYRFVWPDINGKIINEKGKCYGLRNQLGILSDGTIVPCCLDSNGDIPLGNIFEIDSLEEVIN